VISQSKSEIQNILYNYSSAFTLALEKIKAGEKILKLSGLEGSSKFYLITALAKAIERPVLYLVPSKESGDEAADNISFFLGESPPLLLKKELKTKDALFSSHSEEVSGRISWLYSAREKQIIIAEAPALFEKVIPREVFENKIINLRRESLFSRDELISRLRQMGYARGDFVEKVGEISVRGGIVDLFSPGVSNPVRLEFLGDEIHSIRYFSTEDQKSREKIESVTALPASEIILNAETIEESLSYIRRKASEQEVTASVKLSLLEEIDKGNRFPQIEWLLPSFYQNLSTAFDYMPDNTLIAFDDPDEISKSFEIFIDSFSEKHKLLKGQLKITPDTYDLYLTEEEIQKKISRFQRILVEEMDIAEEGVERILFNTDTISIEKKEDSDSPFELLSENVLEWQGLGLSVQIVLQNEVEGKKFRTILNEREVQNVEIRIGNLSSGFIFPEAKLVIVTEKEIFGEKKKLKLQPIKDIPSAFIMSFSELKPGDYIVHVNFGIGIFRGLKRLRVENIEGDFLQCEYQGGDKIYVPVDKLKLVQRYIGDRSPPRVDKLGSENWSRVVKRVKKAVENIARELLELYARRKAETGFQFSKRDKLFREFELSFPYEETSDQEAAIEDVMSDMESPRPMDRLICGDVGFGKTEVALRAAFKAVMDGKQVAFLVPTTLLAYQHYLTSTERLKGYPVIIEMLSRFRTIKEEKEILNKLEAGTIDIIIGTHKLLGDKVKFKDLFLVIIDEEHRFGVKHKEKLRKLKKGVDVLSLSATPIPRTLQLSLAGIRDISLINTPPEGRQSVETYVFQFSKTLIREAITKEAKRGGQVFFIHNRIENIFRMAEELSELVPEVTIDVTHGRMREDQLEKSITKFIDGKTDVLLTTAIVESGLDIPRANTIIVNDAQAFGLADLYQLRGRVGRSEKKAYAYFLIPGVSSLTVQAKRRLKAIGELKELGSGFKLALSDLEIRGAGNIFGTEQSGHIADVGLELYLEILNNEIKKLKKEAETIEYEPEVRINFPAFIPDDYIADEAERLLFYKKISSISREKELRKIRSEFRDRFGMPPQPVLNLLKVVALKLLMKRLFIEKMEIKSDESVIIFHENAPFYHHFRPGGKLIIPLKHGDATSEIRKRLMKLNKSGVMGISEKTEKQYSGDKPI
jgi:transcription-repair coupling factor (superfamily II helicase)